MKERFTTIAFLFCTLLTIVPAYLQAMEGFFSLANLANAEATLANLANAEAKGEGPKLPLSEADKTEVAQHLLKAADILLKARQQDLSPEDPAKKASDDDLHCLLMVYSGKACQSVTNSTQLTMPSPVAALVFIEVPLDLFKQTTPSEIMDPENN